jgi:hypothetical protein
MGMICLRGGVVGEVGIPVATCAAAAAAEAAIDEAVSWSLLTLVEEAVAAILDLP